MTTQWSGTGHPEYVSTGQQQASSLVMDREIAEATRRRQHYWMAIVGYRVTPPIVEGTLLDHEALRQYPVVGCFICEQEWSEAVGRICPGEPS